MKQEHLTWCSFFMPNSRLIIGIFVNLHPYSVRKVKKDRLWDIQQEF